MSPAERRTLGVAGGVLLLGAAFSFFSGPGLHAPTPEAKFSSRDPRGLKALRLFLEESGFAPESTTEGFARLPSGGGRLLLVSPPSARSIRREEAESLYGWVARGNALLYLGREGEEAPPYEAGNALPEVFGLSAAPPRDTSAQAAWNDVLRAGEDRSEIVSVEGPLAAAAEKISRIRTRPVPTPDGWEAILFDRGGAGVVLARAIGDGRAYYLPTSSPLENRLLGRAKNPEFLLALLDRSLPPGGAILLDEYHHGHSGTPPALSILQSSPMRWILAQCALAALLLFLSGGATGAFGAPPRPETPPHLLDGVAHLYGLRLDEAAAAKDLSEAVRRDVRRRTGIDPFLSPDASRARLRGRGVSRARADAALAAVREAAGGLARVDADLAAFENRPE